MMSPYRRSVSAAAAAAVAAAAAPAGMDEDAQVVHGAEEAELEEGHPLRHPFYA